MQDQHQGAAPSTGQSAPVSARSILRNLLSNIPEIMMIGIAIWAADAAAIISFAGILHAGFVLLIILAIVFAAPALWASWQTLKLASFPPINDSSLPAVTSNTEMK